MTAAMFHVKQVFAGGLRGVWQGAGGGLARSGGTLARCGALVAAGMLAACSSPEDIAAGTGLAKAEGTAAASTPAPAKVQFTDNANQGEAKREFSYHWPAEVSAVPELAARFTAERDKLLAEQKTDWAEALQEFAGEDCISCKNLSFSKEWKVVADLPRYLSLSADIYSYTGGAHGNSAFDALVWDRAAGAAIKPGEMFTSQAALQDALGAAWCKALKAERKQRMGADFTDDGFFSCPDIAQLTLLPGSSDRKAFNRIGLIAAPYVAGSYAEGPYEVTLPVTAKLLGAVKPEYKAVFATGK